MAYKRVIKVSFWDTTKITVITSEADCVCDYVKMAIWLIQCALSQN